MDSLPSPSNSPVNSSAPLSSSFHSASAPIPDAPELSQKEFGLKLVEKTLSILKRQKQAASEDLNRLHQLIVETEQDPSGYVRSLLEHVAPRAPKLQRVHRIPRFHCEKKRSAEPVLQFHLPRTVYTSAHLLRPLTEMPSISLAMCHSIDVEEKREDAAQTEQGHVEGPTNEEGEEQKMQKQKEERLNENDIVKTEVEPESTLLTGILPTTVTGKVEKEDFSFMKDSSSAKNSLSSQTKPAQPDEESAESCTEDAKAATPLDRFEQARSRLSELRGILAKHRLPVALRQLPDVSTSSSSSANRLLSPLTPSSPFTTFTTHEGDHTDDIQHVHGWSKEDDERLFHLLRTTHPHAIEDQEECRSLAKALGTKSHRQVTRRLRLLVQQGGVPPPSTSFPSLAGSPSPIGSPGVYQMGQNGRRMDAYTSAIMTAATGHSKGATRSKNSRVSGTFYTRQAFRVCQVTMPDSDGEGEDEKQLSMAFLQSLDDSVKQTSAYRELCDLMAKRKALRQKHNYRKRQQRRMAPVMSDVVHHGFKCDQCQVEPIVGVRYKCRQCPVEKEVDLCCTCFELGTFRNELHDQRHTFKPIETAEILMLDEEMREYAYLDPGDVRGPDYYQKEQASTLL